MGGNSKGSYCISNKAFWEAYDALPATVKERVSQCSVDWVVTSLAKRWKSGKCKPSDLIAAIDNWDRHDRDSHFARLNRMAETGVDYHARLTEKSKRKFLS